MGTRPWRGASAVKGGRGSHREAKRAVSTAQPGAHYPVSCLTSLYVRGLCPPEKLDRFTRFICSQFL